jgi:hypothetical protein
MNCGIDSSTRDNRGRNQPVQVAGNEGQVNTSRGEPKLPELQSVISEYSSHSQGVVFSFMSPHPLLWTPSLMPL